MKKLLILIFIFSSFSLIFAQEVTDKGRISGYMFGDYFYNAARDTGINSLPNAANGGEKDFHGLQFRRIYCAYDYKISEVFSTRFRLAYEPGSYTSDDKLGVFIKDAYIKWADIFEGSDLIVGIQPTSIWQISEEVWGNRFLEQTIMDLRKLASSRDFAISLKGRFDSEGVFKYWIMVGNNSSSKPELDKYKRFYFHFQLTPIRQLTATLYADLKMKPDIEDPTSISNTPATVSNNDLVYALFIGYKEKNKYTFGLEGFLNQGQNGMISNGSLKDKTGMGISVFASYNFINELGLVGRYDYYDPNTDPGIKGDSRNWFIFSLNFQPDEKVTFSPNVVVETYESLPNGRSIDASITPRITFFYTFL